VFSFGELFLKVFNYIFRGAKNLLNFFHSIYFTYKVVGPFAKLCNLHLYAHRENTLPIFGHILRAYARAVLLLCVCRLQLPATSHETLEKCSHSGAVTSGISAPACKMMQYNKGAERERSSQAATQLRLQANTHTHGLPEKQGSKVPT